MLIERLDDYGRGITYLNNKICFVINAYPQDIVEINIVKETTKYYEGTIKKVIKRGPFFSNDNICQNICGGCQFLTPYQYEINFKEDLLKRYFNKYLIKDFVYGKRFNYRNKIVLHYDKVLGFYKNNTNDIIEINNCNLAVEEINEVIKKLKAFISENLYPLEITIKYLDKTLISVKGKLNIDINKFLAITDILYVNNECLTTDKYLVDNNLLIGPNSFYQVNNEIKNKLYEEILTSINPDDRVLDLYSGVGSISSYIANKVGKVVGIEINKEAVKLAKKTNKSNIEFLAGDVIKYLALLKNFNTIIVDPPRSGLDKQLIDKLNEVKINKLIYVSCNIRTLKRDLELLNNYKVQYIRGFNMFPGTYHVECVVLMSKVAPTCTHLKYVDLMEKERYCTIWRREEVYQKDTQIYTLYCSMCLK